MGAHVLRLDGALARLQGLADEHARGQSSLLRKVLRQRAGVVSARTGIRAVHEPCDCQSAGRPRQGGGSSQGRIHHHSEGDRRRHLRLRRQSGRHLLRAHPLQLPRPECGGAHPRHRSRGHVHRADERAGRQARLPRLLRDDGERDGTPFDYPLSSRFDENDAIFIFDNAFVPWEDVLLHRDLEKLKIFFPQSGFLAGYQFQGCTRLAVKLDFLVGVIAKALRTTGADDFRGNQAMLGEVIAWRNLFWALTDAMAMNPTPWVDGAVLPNLQSGSSYRVFAGEAYGRIKEIVEKI